MGRLGLGGPSLLMLLAAVIGVVTAAAAVAFHESIERVRQWAYVDLARHVPLYGRGVWLLVLIPAAGGLAVGLLVRYVIRAREGHGIVDVLESVQRSRGVIRPMLAVEKIVTAAVTIGTGGSAGAEGPIVQIGAAIASAVGRAGRAARQAMPLLIGCGSAAGVSAIFNSPLGGVLFTLEVVLQDFSFRTFTPVVLASVVANVTTGAIVRWLHGADPAHGGFGAIFELPNWVKAGHAQLAWGQVLPYVGLGLACGAVGVGLNRLMNWTEGWFARSRLPRPLRPAVGGAALGLTGVVYVVAVGWGMLGSPKPIPPGQYAMPAFFGDGYGAIRAMLDADFYGGPVGPALALAVVLVGLKVVGTCLTLGSGGSGGIIAPSLFLGAATGAAAGLVARATGWGAGVQPEMLALVGMGAVLGAVVHAPLAAILILFDVTRDDKVMLPAMLATITATGAARLMFRDSIYTMALRARGVRVGQAAATLLHRLTVEQVDLEPARAVRLTDPLAGVLGTVAAARDGTAEVVVTEADGRTYAGLITGRDLQTAVWERDAAPLLVAGDLTRADVPTVSTSDDLASVLDLLTATDLPRLPVTLPGAPDRVIGMISRAGLMRRYHRAITEGG